LECVFIKKLEELRVFKLGNYQTQVELRLEHWKNIGFIKRLSEKDHTLWFPKSMPEITDRLGWLTLPESMRDQLEDFLSFANKIQSEGIYHVILLGMGGSSLASEVFQKIFGNRRGYPKLIVLDSTHPLAVLSVENKIDLRSTLFIVSSKSGTTLETLSLFKYFWDKVGKVDKYQGRHFVAITDSNTPLMKLAEKRRFRRIFQAPRDVGGRFSALTAFGLVPAALIGMNIHDFLDRAWVIAEHCAFCVSPYEMPALSLASTISELAKMGRDKVTFFSSKSLQSFIMWIEQLLAESLGKEGKGIIPIVNEPITSLENYGEDRLFIYYFIENEADSNLEKLMDDLEVMGHPVVRINVIEKANLSQEIFSWEIAVAAAGSVLGIHPFDQPDVQLAKDIAKEMMEKKEKRIEAEVTVETISIEDSKKLSQILRNWLNQAKMGDYVAIQAYLSATLETTETLQKIRLELLNKLKLATTLGYGPRFLHSTGQLHKGGPDTGIFLQLVDEPTEDLKIPETNYTFGTLIKAQSLGDFQALKQLDRRVLRINLGKDTVRGLSLLFHFISKYNEGR
jgi:transaldolase/glucose-6-phosphate isomerase